MNMSYCRFQNTQNDFQDCLENFDDPDLSREEKSARAQLLVDAYLMIQKAQEMTGLSGEEMEELLDREYAPAVREVLDSPKEGLPEEEDPSTDE